MASPTDLSYSPDHEWVRTEADGQATIGITAYAANALGDIVYLGLPGIGDRVAAGGVCGEIESTKSVSDLTAPIAGQVTAVNEHLADDPSAVNHDPYGAGWLFAIRCDAEPTELLDADSYDRLTQES